MGEFHFPKPGFQNNRSYLKQKEFSKSGEANLKIRDNTNFGIFMSKKYFYNYVNLATWIIGQCYQNEQFFPK